MSRWYELYSPRLNEDKIVKLFEKFNIKKYNFVNNGFYDYDVLIEYGLYQYKLILNTKMEELLIYRKSSYRKGQKTNKEFNKPCKKIHNDVWFQAIKFIIKQYKLD